MTEFEPSSNLPLNGQSAAPRTVRGEFLALGFALIAAVAVFANGVGGDFVYDDHYQIVGNELIKRIELLPRALVSDVFAFKGPSDEPWSNYWRPTYVAWLSLNYQLFGLRPAYWHIMNLVQHLAVIVMAYLLLRQLGAARWMIAATLLIFAVHPVHVESVTWISSADMLMSIPLLGALIAVLRSLERKSVSLLIFACALYVVAQLAKEVAVVTPAIIFGAVYAVTDDQMPCAKRLRRALIVTSPFLLLACVYLGARVLVLGRVGGERMPWDTGLAGAVMTAPSIGAFYLRQVFFPLWIGPSYPLRVVTIANAGILNLVVPLAICLISAMIALALSRRSKIQAIGLLLFALPLAPTMNVNAFVPEQIVHDRYLYLPLLGMIMLVWPAVVRTLQRLFHITEAKAGAICVLLALAICVPLSAKTISYNRTWMSESALWQTAVQSDPTSSANWMELGRVFKEAGQFDQAIEALNRALSIAPATLAYVNRAETLIEQGRYFEAEADLRKVLERFPDHFAAWERLALMFERQGELDRSLETLREARRSVPNRTCVLTDMMAIVLVQMNRPNDAIAELESIRAEIPSELSEHAALALYRLGVLYATTGRRSQAEAALREFLDLTAGSIDPTILHTREEVMQIMGLH